MEVSEKNNNWTMIKKVDPDCFACGFDNKHGLNMCFETNGEQIRSLVHVPSHLRGWSNLVHGGIISTMIDETMSWAAIHLLDKFILTKNMNVEFKKPLTIETPIVMYGYIVEQKDERNVTMAADVYDTEGTLYSRGKGEFALFSTAQFSKIGVIGKKQIERMSDAFEWPAD
jgi:acyl-coenzyme A thioesterase PaaI-like protein